MITTSTYDTKTSIYLYMYRLLVILLLFRIIGHHSNTTIYHLCSTTGTYHTNTIYYNNYLPYATSTTYT